MLGIGNNVVAVLLKPPIMTLRLQLQDTATPSSRRQVRQCPFSYAIAGRRAKFCFSRTKYAERIYRSLECDHHLFKKEIGYIVLY